MSNGEPEATDNAPPSSTFASPERLRREAVSLGLILLASLILAVLGRRGPVAGAGYASTFTLLVLSVWYKRRFHYDVPLFSFSGKYLRLRLALSITLVAFLMLVACVPHRDFHSPEPSALDTLHLLILVPLAEELYFRGLLLEHLRRSFGSVQAALLCSSLFAVLHFPFPATLVTGCLSLVACMLVLKTGTLAYALQLHIAWNALAGIWQVDHYRTQFTLALIASGAVTILAIACSKEPRSRFDADAS